MEDVGPGHVENGICLAFGGRVMRGILQLGIVLFLLLMLGGLGFVFILRVRAAADRMRCANNLKLLGMALRAYESAYRHYPAATVPNPELPPDQRLGWLIELWPNFMQGGAATNFDQTKAWDAEPNCPPRWRVREMSEDLETHWYREEVVGEVPILLCPSNPALTEPSLPCATHYVGLAGVGENATALPLTDSRAGFFGYDRTLTLADIKDGTGMTLAIVEALDGGPWTAGGRATVRGLATDGRPYLGREGQFGSHHVGGGNALFADGSVRHLATSVSLEVVEALATIAGHEEVSSLDHE
jgi:prepilin-type processing-associated H-X9-DG protein